MSPSQPHPQQQKQPASSITVADIYYVVFRHKWKIAICAVLGLIAAATVYFAAPRKYVSNSKILVRYVAENSSFNPADKDDRIKSPDERGQGILNSEIQILVSRDLVEQVVKQVGPEKVLAKAGGGNSAAMAAGIVLSGLKVEILPKSSVMSVTLEHPDAEMAHQVLRTLVDRYLERHNEIHRAAGAFVFLNSQTMKLRDQLTATEENLRKARTNAGVASVDDAKKSYAAELAQLYSAINAAEVELEGRKAALKQREKWAGRSVATNSVAAEAQQPVPPRELGLYKSITERLDALRIRELENATKYTDSNPVLQGLRAQIAELEKRRTELETAHPQLALVPKTVPGAPDNSVDLLTDLADIAALEARIKALSGQLDKVRSRVASLEVVENSIRDLERQREIEEANYRYFSASLEKARIDRSLDPSQISNLAVVQIASPSGLNMEKIYKIAGGALGGGLALGLLIAFGIEFGLDHSVKRSADLEKKLRIPTILTIPDLAAKKSRRFFRRKRSTTVNPASNGVALATPDASALPSDLSPLTSYYEALRDRLIVHFDGVTHKPKLVGVTSCSRGAGSSSIAAGLAAALSETGDGNVLLVDLNIEKGSAHGFYRGKPVCTLHEAVEEEKRSNGLVQENLYLASLSQVNGIPQHKIPSKRIAEAMPKLKASDYDYIIFDMPPVSQTSITYRVAGLMDKVLMVVESEKTHRGVLQEAHRLLVDSKAKVSAVLNKQHQYVPKMLHQELNGTEV